MALSQVGLERLNTDTTDKLGERKNLIINGAMQVAQRGTSFTDIGGSAGVYTLDRFRSGFTMNAGRYTITQDSNSPDGFGKSLKVDVTTQEPSLNVASGVQISQFFEGQDLQQLQKGTSSAKSMTLSFYVKSTTIGTYIVEFQDQDNSRINNKAYTINNPNTWEKKTITVEGDTTGAFTNDNNASLLVQFFLAAGTNFTSGTLQNTWGTNTNANRAVGQTNLFASTSNDWAITGVQLEVGSVATDFEHRSYAQELALCQRYFEKSFAQGVAPAQNHAGQVGYYSLLNIGSRLRSANIPFKVVKRTSSPTMTFFNPFAANANARIPFTSTDLNNIAIDTSGDNWFGFTSTDTTPSPTYCHLHWTADTEL